MSNRRQLIRQTAAFGLMAGLVPGFALALAAGAAVSGNASATAPRPNIVWLVSEDNSTHFMRLFDKNGPPTPAIEKLAEHGLVYEHAFSCAPVCSAARTTLASGCFGPRIFTQFHRKEVVVPMPEGLQMFHGYLADAGYYTANNKKTDYNAETGGAKWMGNETWRDRRPGQPFFYFQSVGTTHESRLHFPESDIGSQPTQTDPATVFVPAIHPKTEIFRYTYARQHDNIMRMDAEMGAIVAELEKDGLLEDTFIFYFGDHGGVLAGSKGYAWETGLHVPLVVRVPENFKHLVPHEPGSRVGEFVSFIDFGPTVLSLAGIEIPEQMDGRPFLGKGVTKADLEGRDVVYGYADRFDEKYDFVRTARKGQYKYMRSYQPFNFDGIQNDYRYLMAAYREWRELHHAGKLNEIQDRFFQPRDPEALYDVERDPYETKNLAKNPAYAETLSEMRGLLDDWVRGMPDLSFYPESYLAAHALSNPVQFGQQHKSEIAALIDTANLQLVDSEKAAPGIQAALAAEDPWQRYWGLIVCSSHGEAAKQFVGKAKQLAAGDSEPLVMARAAQFLAILGEADPQEAFVAALAKSTDRIETNLILNMAVQIQDGGFGYTFDFSDAKIVREGRYVNARLEYLALGTPACSATPKVEFSNPPAEEETYDFVEIVLQISDPDVANPFTDASVQGVFAPEGSEPVTVDGFCDSPDGSVFRIRFMPSRPGRHEYSVTYRQPGLERTQTGSFNAVASARRGLLRLDPANRLHFLWEGTGEHYFWNGTTTYYLMGWDDETIRRSIDRLHRLKINRLRVLVYGRNEPRPWGQPVVPTENFQLHLNPWVAERPDDIESPGFDLKRFNVDHWRKYERLLRYAREKDVIVSVIFFIGAQVLPTPFEADSAEERLYYRYAVARLAAFSNVTWDLGNEYNFHRQAPDWADRMGHRVKDWDPYDHLTSAHNVAHRTPKSTWLDMQLIQRWDSGQTEYMLGQRAAQEKTGHIIPQINEEYGYEDLWEKYPGHRAAETRRKDAWEITMAGCYQTTGESARRGTGVPPDTGGGWVNGRGDDTMTMLIGYGHMVDFFTAFDWWNCQPLSDAVEGAASCLGKPGQLYILYFREGGRANVQLTEHQYRGKWFNPRAARWEGACQGSGVGWTTPPTPDNQDWVLWLERDDTLKDTTPPKVVSALSGGKGHRIFVEFDEQMESASATNPAHYRIEPDVEVQTVSLEGRHGKTAVLTVEGLEEDRRYTLQVRGVKDRGGNEIKATKVVFEYTPPGRPLVELRFNEGQGRTAANAGTLRNLAERVSLTAERPQWSTNTPPGGGSHSLDFGATTGPYAVDLPDAAREALEGLRSFTITAWLNRTSDEEGPGGNRIVHMADTQGSRAGIDLVITRDGRLKIGVNEWPDQTQAATESCLIPVDPNAGKDNWRFIAVTYDSTAAKEHVKLYVGTTVADIRLHRAVSYDRGPVGKGAGVLTVGHFNPAVRSNHTDRMFRGLVDEVRIFGSMIDGSGALSLDKIRTIHRL